MCRLIETIRIEDGQPALLGYHQRRFDFARATLYPDAQPIELETILDIPPGLQSGVAKARVTYGRSIERVEFSPYQMRPIRSLMVVYSDTIRYPHKYADRNALHQLFEQRMACDDILIVKNGRITDTYYCNIVVENAEGRFTTDTPLLSGTRRAYLLDQNVIRSRPLHLQDLAEFHTLYLINAMIPLGQLHLPVQHVYGL